MSRAFFGIGAMKAGTTWLHRLLGRHPDCGLPPEKELHFFDLRHTLRADLTLHEPETWWAGRIATLAPDDSEKQAQMLEVSRLRTPADYLAYLSRFENHAYGEITPAYARLPPEGFREICSLFSEARFIFIMRDPVARLWSQLRSQAPRSNSRLALGDDVLSKSRYDDTIRNLESVVPSGRILYLFYETLFCSEAIEQIESFLGLKPLPDTCSLLEKRVNVSPPAELDPEMRMIAREILAPTYGFIERQFGRPAGWMY
jgi:hypothetical protein